MPDYKNDIERYLNNEMTDIERHALEKKALSDPFLADALEGIDSLTSAEFSQDMNQLHAQINTHRKNTFLWPLQIAAGIIIVASTIFITIKFSDEGTNDQLALEKQNSIDKEKKSSDNIPSIQEKESNGSLSSEQSIPKEKPTSAKSTEAPTKNQILQEEKSIDANATSSQQIQSEADVSETETSKEVTDENITQQKPQAQPKEVAKSFDQNQAAPPALYNDRAGPASSAPTRSMSLNKKSEAAKGASPSKDDAQDAITAPTPVGGFISFNEYIEDNLKYPQLAIENNIQGDVIIQFQINANGSYENFSITKGLGYGCDEEAIRLIKDGPAWTPKFEDDKAVESSVRMPITFKIEKSRN